MAKIEFPSSPTEGQQHIVGEKTWRYESGIWRLFLGRYGRIKFENTWEENNYFKKAISAGKDSVGPGLVVDILGDSKFDGDILLKGHGTFEQSIGSHDHDPELIGWKLTNVTGLSHLDIRSIFANELHAKAFIADLDLALLSGHIVTKSVSQLSRSFVVPAVDSNGTIYVEDFPGFAGSQVFEDGDWIRLQVVDKSGGGLRWFAVWGIVVVGSYNLAGDENDGEQSFQITIKYAGATGLAVGETVNAGSAAQDFGQSGDGYIEQQAAGVTAGGNRPYLRIATWVTNPYTPGNISTRVRLGNVTGFTGSEEILGGYDTTDDKTKFRVGNTSSFLDFNITESNRITLRGSMLQRPSGESADIRTFRGEYNPATLYYKGDEVFFNSVLWLYINNTPQAGYQPDEEPLHWHRSDGIDGVPGQGLNNRGQWVTATTYNPGDYCFDRSSADPGVTSIWILKDTDPYYSETQPYLDTTHWEEFAGVPGADAKILHLVATAQTFKFNKDGVPSPPDQSIAFTAFENNLSGTLVWSTIPTVTLVGSGNTRELTIANFGANDYVQIKIAKDGLEDYITVYRTTDGSDSILSMLTNEAHTVPADADGSNPDLSNAHSFMKIKKGSFDVTSDWTFSDSSPGKVVSGCTATVTTSGGDKGKITVTAMTADVATVTVTATHADHDDQVKVFTLTKSKKGAEGGDARILHLTATAQTFKYDLNGNPDPTEQSIYFEAVESNLGGSLVWTTDPVGITLIGTGNTRQLTIANFGVNKAVVVQIDKDGLTDYITVYRITDGSPNLLSFLTNESHNVPANHDGSSPDLSGAISFMKIMRGSVDVTADWTFSNTQIYAVDGAAGKILTNCTATITTTGTDKGKITITGMSADTATVTVVVTKTDFPNLWKTFTVTKSRRGIPGDTGAAGPVGPSPVFQGIYSDVAYYHGNTTRVDVVKIHVWENSEWVWKYYVARHNAPESPFTGKNPTTEPTYWQTFGAQFESVATKLLFAELAYVENLGVRFLRTATDGQRIFIDGANNRMRFYDSNDNIAIDIDEQSGVGVLRLSAHSRLILGDAGDFGEASRLTIVDNISVEGDAEDDSVAIIRNQVWKDRYALRVFANTSTDGFGIARFIGSTGKGMHIMADGEVNVTGLSSQSKSHTLTGTTHYYALDLGVEAIQLLTLTGSMTIHGIAAKAHDKVYLVANKSIYAYDVTIKNESTSASASNRIIHQGGDYVLAYGQSCIIFYDRVSSRWRIASKT